MTAHASSDPVVLVVMAAVAVFALPVMVAAMRDVEGKADIVLLWLFLGWAGVPWACALVMALTRPSRRSPSLPVPAPGPSVAHVAATRDTDDPYADGAYLISAGLDSNTWAVHSSGEWRIIYEVGGVDRLAGPVTEVDIPLSVLAEALRPAVS
jgi:hypothetical protein